jgi:hypothetical protein
MVDGIACQCVARPLIARRLAQLDELRDSGFHVEQEQASLESLQRFVNDDRTRKLWDQLSAEGN